MTKVLVIENEEQTREILLDFLELEGFEAIGAENGLVGVEKAHSYLPDIIPEAAAWLSHCSSEQEQKFLLFIIKKLLRNQYIINSYA